MTAEDRWVLPADLLVSPVSQLDEAVRAELAAESGSMVLTRPRHRRRGVVVDADTARLLEVFRVPSTLPEAVLLHAVLCEQDPQQVLLDAYPVLQQLREARYLVPPDQVAATAGQSLVRPGAPLGRWQVERSLQVFDDSDVYLGAGPDGPVALKVVRPGAPRRTLRALERERAVLEVLERRDVPAPRVLGTSGDEREPDPVAPAWLALSWVGGKTVETEAARLRRRHGPASAEAFALCAALVRAYERLHAAGVLHGDVHPTNAILQPSGDVVLIDFGLAAVVDGPPGVPTVRGGIGWAFEPELARSAVAGRGDVPVTARGEQYSLAAVCFYLLTGVHHLDLPLERMAMFAALADGTPRLLSDAPGVEAASVAIAEPVLARALSGRPEQRHADLRELVVALSDQAVRLTRDDGHQVRGTDAFVAGLSTPRDAARFDLAPAPRSTIAHGGAGVALALMRLAGLRGEPELLAAAQAWTADALLGLVDERGRLEPRLGISAETVSPISIFHSATGVHVTDALVAHAVGDFGGVARAVGRYLEAAGPVPDTDELVNGEAGLVVGAALLVSGMLAPGAAPAVDRVSGWLRDRVPGLAGRTDATLRATRTPLGLAHGVAGPVLAVALADRAQPSGGTAGLALAAQLAARLRERPVRSWAPSGLQHSWCNGSAGALLALAVAGGGPDPGLFADLAEHAAGYRGPNPSLCCGSAGVGFSLLVAGRAADDRRWTLAAREQSDRAVADLELAGPRAHSLHKGALGAVLLADEVRDAGRPAFPGLLPELTWT